MADEGDVPPGGSEYDRMSLGSLKRELEAQKGKTELAREEARERMRADEKKARAFPWGTVIAIAVVGGGGFFGLVYAMRESFPAVAHSVLPVFLYVSPDAGPPAVPDAAVIAHDAGVDAHHTLAHHAHPPPSSGAGHGDDLGLGDLGGGSDPIEGVGGSGR